MSENSLTILRYLPNSLSLLRILLIPLIIFLSLRDWPAYAFGVYIIGALTDLLDGHLARRFGWHSHFGSILDPVADKLLVLCLMPLLWYQTVIPPLFTLLVILRYSAQLSVFPVLLGWLKRPFKVAPKQLPKLATVVAFIVLGLGFAQQLITGIPLSTPVTALFISNLLIAAAGIGCILEAWVLITFVPRYWQIARGTHDTFE
ncbi:MAG: CDP-alcohol phosphatidyltransferase family protein [Gammaproteobacteria bacterium]|nr:CDP-alcohol phosphatidyltransferase family protein [Gammaproteobacteria bacterium]